MLYATEYIQTGTVNYSTEYPHYINISISWPYFKNGNLQGCCYKSLFTITFTNKKHKAKLKKWFIDNITTITSLAICFKKLEQFAKDNRINYQIMDN